MEKHTQIRRVVPIPTATGHDRPNTPNARPVPLGSVIVLCVVRGDGSVFGLQVSKIEKYTIKMPCPKYTFVSFCACVRIIRTCHWGLTVETMLVSIAPRLLRSVEGSARQT